MERITNGVRYDDKINAATVILFLVGSSRPQHAEHKTEERVVYLSFFLGRSWLVCPHFFLRQLGLQMALDMMIKSMQPQSYFF
jgi:hypothetical protein